MINLKFIVNENNLVVQVHMIILMLFCFDLCEVWDGKHQRILLKFTFSLQQSHMYLMYICNVTHIASNIRFKII